ncbi:DUF3857 domain-containing protein [uncultured Aquimarina sp.]|uniref:transglutaminase domain-containing protein n=1 Tax=uncultured Aquimarina sp. TaxID=575652 RepID=UPI00261C506C|nr:DUF3857 domain-containing protein [uncultured Aquimarina sp.]
MHKSFLSVLFLSLSFLSISQENYNYKSLVVSEADLKGTRYEKDTTANAFFIYEKGFSRIENGGNYNLLTDYSGKIKILNKEGFDESTIEVLLYRNKSRKEILRNLIAFTHNLENGKIVKTKLEEDKIYREKYNDHYTLVKFAFPNVKPGSVITYSYQTESPFIFNFNGWDFQDDIPKMYSEYINDLPGNYLYNIRLVGPLKLDVEESSIKRECIELSNSATADCSHNQYIMKDIPAFKEEKYMTAKKNYFSRVEYELREYKGFDGVNKKYTETWKNVDKELRTEKTIGIQLKKANATKNVLPEAIKTMPISLEKAKAIYKHVTNNYTWNKKYRIFRDVDIKEILKSKVGNVAEMNILLHNIYKEQGFTVKPVLLSTRSNGYATKVHPVLTDFNYLIIQLTIDQETHLLDATEKTLAFGQIPFRCLNQYARLLDFKKGSSWIDITSKNRSSHYYREKLKLTNKLTLEGEAKYTYNGYHAYFRRKAFDKVLKEKYLNKILNDDENLTVSEASLQNEDDLEKPFIEEVNFTKSTEQIEDIIYLKPFTKSFFKENPFKLNERTYPVDFGYNDSYSYIVLIEIPENCQFLDIPENKNYVLPGKTGKLSLNFQLAGDKLQINHNIKFLSSYYPVEYYDSLKEFFNLIVDMENNTVITIKKTS